MSGPRIAVVGAGIVGASLAYHLAARGASVTLLDAAEPAAGVTRRAFSWINIAHADPHPYEALRQAAIGDWHRVEAELGGAVQVDWCGALAWEEDLADTRRQVAHHAAAGCDVRLLTRSQIADLEPGLVDPPRVAAHAPGEGAVDPVAATRAFCAAARAAGADLRFGAQVSGLIDARGTVAGLTVDGEELAADIVIAAAGMGSVDLVRGVGVDLPVHASPSVLIRMRVEHPLVRGIVAGPDFEVRQGGDTLLLSAASYIDDTPENGPDSVGRRVLNAVRAGLRGGESATLIDTEVGWRPMPDDDGPIIGFTSDIGGLYLAAMHGGIILAPVIGRLAADEILGGHAVDALQLCRPDRFHL
ncbi:MAG: FAD-binding oxidoreductase [Thalassobaculaceae bacterium]|nr:FAD-binding oxidoreductase [Thalassobaculaceae bacterium]